MEKRKPLFTVEDVNVKTQPVWKTVRQFLRKLKMEILYDPVMPKKMKTSIRKDICTSMFTAAIFTKHVIYLPRYGSK